MLHHFVVGAIKKASLFFPQVTVSIKVHNFAVKWTIYHPYYQQPWPVNLLRSLAKAPLCDPAEILGVEEQRPDGVAMAASLLVDVVSDNVKYPPFQCDASS